MCLPHPQWLSLDFSYQIALVSCSNLEDPGAGKDTNSMARSCAIDNGECSHLCMVLEETIQCSCPSGLELDGSARNCVDIDECQVDDICGHGDCINQEASYQCECQLGWTGMACDECEPGYFGPSCTPCQCVYGDCADTIEGDGQCDCLDGYTGNVCDQIDPSNPPEEIRLRVQKGDVKRILNLDRYSVRANDSIAAKIVYSDRVEFFEVEPVIRTYRGYCEEEPDALVSAMLLPSGALRYQIIRGNPNHDWSFIPDEEREAAEPMINYEVIGGEPSPRSGVPLGGTSYTPAFAGPENEMRINYRATVSFIINKAYIDLFQYGDHDTIIRKAESTITRTNAVYIRDLLTETQIRRDRGQRR